MQAKIGRFEDLVAWQKARVLTRDIYAVTQQGRFAKDFGLSGQIQRAAVSIMSNLAEALSAAAGQSSTTFFRLLSLHALNYGRSYT
jgi:four helix bundle protein